MMMRRVVLLVAAALLPAAQCAQLTVEIDGKKLVRKEAHKNNQLFFTIDGCRTDTSNNDGTCPHRTSVAQAAGTMCCNSTGHGQVLVDSAGDDGECFGGSSVNK